LAVVADPVVNWEYVGGSRGIIRPESLEFAGLKINTSSTCSA
jgi:hypothetical protein